MRRPTGRILTTVAFAAIALLHAVLASGQTNRPQTTPSPYDRIWKFAEWYRNDANPVLQWLRFSGRFQLDYARVDADEGNAREWNVRRMRLGLQAGLFGTFKVHVETDLNPQESDPLYVKLTDAYLEWRPRQTWALTIGKQAVPFTVDGATSSKELIAMERSNLSNNLWFPDEYLPGVSVSGTAGRWGYRSGVYSAGAENREFGDFTGGVVFLERILYDVNRTPPRTTQLTFDYVHQTADDDNSFTRPFAHVVSVGLRHQTSGWGFRSDVTAAAGYFSQSDALGVMAMPFVNLTRKLQLAGRYVWLKSAAANGLTLAAYESRVIAGRGDRYHDAWLGLNYYLYGHQLKLQTGIQLAKMRDVAADGGHYSGVAWTAGVRIGW